MTNEIDKHVSVTTLRKIQSDRIFEGRMLNRLSRSYEIWSQAWFSREQLIHALDACETLRCAQPETRKQPSI